MPRTRLRQVDQIRSSFTYRDDLNMGLVCEHQPDQAIAGTFDITDITAATKTIVIGADIFSDPTNVNVDDILIISDSLQGNNGTYTIASVTAGVDETTLTVLEDLNADESVDITDGASFKADPGKNLLRDLNFIRTQLRRLNQTDDWFDEPVAAPTPKWELITGSNVLANTDILVPDSGIFDAGEPYTLKVYLNGQLLLPSVVSSNSVVTQYDYVEKDVSGPVGLGETGDRLSFAFDIDDTDLIQLKWTKS